jgi:hypothetical protein
MKTKMALALALAGVLVSACAVVAPGATAVKVTNDADSVEHCFPLGNIELQDSRNHASIEAITMRNQASGMGADTLLVTSTEYSKHATGIAYRCK